MTFIDYVQRSSSSLYRILLYRNCLNYITLHSFFAVYDGLNTTDRESRPSSTRVRRRLHRLTAPVPNQASSSCRSACLFVSTMLHCVCGVIDSSSTQPRPRSSVVPHVDGNMRSLRFRYVLVTTLSHPPPLGIYVDCDASMSSHVSKTVKNCFAALRQIHNVRRSVTRPVLLSLVSALVLSRLDYGSATLAGLPTYLLNRLQSVLNAAARLVHSARKHHYVTPLLREIHWLRMRQRIDYKLAVLIFSCLYGQAPPYLTEGLQRVAEVDARRHLRSASTNAHPRVARPSVIALSQWPLRESGTRFH